MGDETGRDSGRADRRLVCDEEERRGEAIGLRLLLKFRSGFSGDPAKRCATRVRCWSLLRLSKDRTAQGRQAGKDKKSRKRGRDVERVSDAVRCHRQVRKKVDPDVVGGGAEEGGEEENL
jgi:hypothetical protein